MVGALRLVAWSKHEECSALRLVAYQLARRITVRRCEWTARDYLGYWAEMEGSPDTRQALWMAAASQRRADIIAAIGRPITWGLVSHWIKGRKPMPQWAIDNLCARLDSAAMALRNRAAKATKEEQGARHWRAYHARRAREKDEQARKEKGQL